VPATCFIFLLCRLYCVFSIWQHSKCVFHYFLARIIPTVQTNICTAWWNAKKGGSGASARNSKMNFRDKQICLRLTNFKFLRQINSDAISKFHPITGHEGPEKYSDTSANEDFFAVFRTRLTNVLVDARANIKQQT
jgi:hypothetical protein